MWCIKMYSNETYFMPTYYYDVIFKMAIVYNIIYYAPIYDIGLFIYSFDS